MKSIGDLVNNRVLPTNFLNYREYLQELYNVLKESQQGYSYTKMSVDLGLSESNVLYLIIKNKRPLTRKAADKLVSALRLGEIQKLYFYCLVDYQNARDTTMRDEHFKRLVKLKGLTLLSDKSRDQLEFFNEWYHSAIYQMAFLPSFNDSPEWIAEHLVERIRPEQIRKSIALMETLGLLARNKISGKLVPIQTRISTPHEVESMAIIRYHQKMIDLAKTSLTHTPAELRDITSITISLNLEQIRGLKEELAVFRTKILALADAEPNPACVFQLNLQLFPLQKPDTEI